MTDKENYEWLVKPKAKKLHKGINICSTGYDDEDLNVPESRLMSKNIDAMMEEAKRIQTAKKDGKRPPVDKPKTGKPGDRPQTTGELYDDLKLQQMRMRKINKRDHLSEMWGVMKYGSKPVASTYKTTHSFGDEMKDELKTKDYTHHFKWDKFKEYSEAMVVHKDSIRK
mmetsp:Transcript_11908/g.13444  ORF Transcript_11908/g.13444 Transcript_11908/m.13444 type:complete len:169 (-) Transcript_11908:40-546(-)|eukprot:CAMPEP_0205822164 /NCGR_PEP_ID=MMETSP0206-20130828/11220_1 /ASSEMBLY_ACC=CAM_ASM_000279 /TAXON_ID=36767 /ORGANISM="Euplotes focardii, Strain TN1" /LENGTH=168 /DNA_ID=CAMNT_0053118197 /DNA_START=18 /DNA_END=524 /DNA_ORIENTATION=+